MTTDALARATPFPACMMPDGADPCEMFTAIVAERDALQRDIAMRPHFLSALYEIREALGFNKYYPLSRLADDARTVVRERDALRERLAQAEREVRDWREAARYDPTVPAPSFRAWNRSQLDRCRRRYIEAALAPKPKENADDR